MHYGYLGINSYRYRQPKRKDAAELLFTYAQFK